jgi:hypothetical protein
VPRVGELGQGQGIFAEVLTPIVTGFVGQGQGVEGTVLLSACDRADWTSSGIECRTHSPSAVRRSRTGQGIFRTVLPSYVQAAIGAIAQTIESQVHSDGNVRQGQAISGLLRGQQIEGSVGLGARRIGAFTAPYFQGSIGQGQGVKRCSAAMPCSMGHSGAIWMLA